MSLGVSPQASVRQPRLWDQRPVFCQHASVCTPGLHVPDPSAPKLSLAQRKPLIPQFLKFSLSNKPSQSLQSLLTIKGLGVAERRLGLVFTWLRRVCSEIPQDHFQRPDPEHGAWLTVGPHITFV